MSTKKGIGIIGYGGFGEFIHRAWNQMDNAHVVAICDSDPARNPGGDVKFYTEDAAMLADPDVDIVSVATPPSTHRDFSIQAMKAGKHVLIEKPLALTVEDGELIIRVAQQTGRVASVNFVLRYNPIVEMIKNITEKEVLGRIRRVDLRNYAMQETVPEGHWFWNPQVSGRILLEHGVHFFDLASWIVNGKAAETCAMGVERKSGMEDRMFAGVKYDNDVIGTFWHSFSRPRELETTTFHFAYDLGEIDMIGWIPLALDIWGWTDKKGLDVLKELSDGVEISANRIDMPQTKSSEFTYNVEYDLEANVILTEPKLDVYADNLRSIMNDLIQAIDNPQHQMRVTLDDALEAVRVAEMATRYVHPEG